MPRPTSVSVSSQAASAWIPVNYKQSPFNIGMGVVLTDTPTLTYSVQHTFDDVQDENATLTPFNNEGMDAKAANEDGNYAFPVRAIRLNVTAWTAGTATLTIIQGS